VKEKRIQQRSTQMVCSDQDQTNMYERDRWRGQSRTENREHHHIVTGLELEPVFENWKETPMVHMYHHQQQAKQKEHASLPSMI
jgi:hypothetical protein